MVIFAPQNLIMDPPFTKLDILICRNLLIYLTPELQKKLLPLFHYSLNPGGVLFLGSAETIGSFTDLFAPLDGKVAALPAARIGPAGGTGGVSRLVCPRPAGCAKGVNDGETARPTSSRWRTSCSCSTTPRRPCWSTTRVTSSTSAGGRASTWSRRPARPTGTSLPWPAKGCATSWPAPSRRRSGKKRRSPSRVSRSGPTAGRRSWTSPSRRSKSRRRCGGW